MRTKRPISWLKRALRDYQDFPPAVQTIADDALSEIADGGAPDIAKPMSGLGGGVWELAIKARGDAWRVVYTLQLADTIWVIHAFQKKSKRGIATPKQEIDVVRERLKRLKEKLA